ncbi:hypothetical protein [Cellulomonas wangsupingiae]|uniref:Tetratricopeptide repeat protein n=1 Tax=Cellulomonas wangsupingiae TaxID=2968085 RepID=A0ABY5K8D1_9CELL|nr:hypothetical protein [Cellulomonas wangsupingiae]MCC2333008.1 hypothetical protein [Cellulomonas wangsupingiae]MCM0640366.1 hypothetical protein [Cellulomonas wangsupingiae]UUI66724.1 hypothetical protein NP075_08525 [Cellulomonas wangsupingiae]
MVGYRIDTTTLREVPQDVGATWERVEELERQGADGDGERVVWLRILGALASAERLAWADSARHAGPGSLAELPLAAAGGVPPTAWRPLLRLAQVMHRRGRLDAADEAVEAVRRAARVADDASRGDDVARRDCSAVLAFADQVHGAMHFDAGRDAEAVHLFSSALERRTRDGAPADQVESSRIALEAAAVRAARVRSRPGRV